jgi:hypothetical protein
LNRITSARPRLQFRTRHAVIGLTLVGLQAAAAVAAPRAVFVEPTHMQLGEVEPGTTQKLEWTLRNDGDAPLLIESITPTCYCTTGKADDKQLAPKASTKIRVTVDPSDFVGKINKGVEVATNDPATPRQILDVDLTVRPGIAVVPPELDFGSVAAAGSDEKKVDLKAAKERPFQVKSATSDAPWIVIVTEPLQIEERAGTRLFIKVKPGVPPGPFATKVVVETNDTGRPKIEIPIRGTGAGGLVVEPAKLVFDAASSGQEVGSLVVRGDKGLKVTGVKSSTPSLEAAVVPQPDGSFKVNVKVASGAKSGRVLSKLFVATSDAAQPELAVPVMGMVK